MTTIRAWLVLALATGWLASTTAAPAMDGDILEEDAVAFLVAIRDVAIFGRTATVDLDKRMTADLGIAATLHKVAPGVFIAPLTAGGGYMSASYRRIGRCRYEERYTLVLEAGAAPPKSQTPASEGARSRRPFTVAPAAQDQGNAPDRTYDFTKASFGIAPSTALADKWALEVSGDNVVCLGSSLCFGENVFQDVTATSGEAAHARKAQELERVLDHFRKTFCPGARP